MNTPSGTGLGPLLRDATRPERRRMALATGLGALTAGAGVALLGLSGWFLAGAAVAGAAGPAAAIAFNTPLPSACIRLFAMLRTAGRYGERLLGHDGALRSLARLRPVVFERLAAAPPAWALSLDPGDAAARLVEDVGEIEQHLVRRLAGPACLGGLAAGAVALALATGWRGVVAVGVVILAEWGLVRGLVLRQMPAHGALPQALGALRAASVRVQRARLELRAHGLETAAHHQVMRHADEVCALQRRIARQAGWLGAARSVAAVFAALLALLFTTVAGAAGPGWAGSLTVRAALAMLAALAMVEAASAPIAGLERTGPLRTAWRRLDALLQRAPAASGAAIQPARALGIDGVRLPPGRVVALVGASGAGKTTLLETLTALRPVPRGRITLGDEDLANLPAAVARGQFAFAAQEAPVLSGTLRDNLRIASPQADDDTLHEVLAAVGLDRRVGKMRQGLDSWLDGDGGPDSGGIRLSGGEARRLGVARALLRPAPWLLLDEPTEGLDAAAEARVVAGLRAHLTRSGQGAIIVSHRPAPLALAEMAISAAIAPARPA